METYFKIKLVEKFIEYGVIALLVLFWTVVILINVFGDKWDKRQEKKSEKFWKEHGDE